ncbi:MAG TPA: hypothetical protein VMB80_04435 [Candidatus Acidoferrum sp.]|nr:hypothetical protein [Candidatus Acidoferrum sp.]
MKRLSKEKRNQLIIVVVATLAVLGLIYFGLIQRQYSSLEKIHKAKKEADAKLVSIRNTITNAAVVTNELSGNSVILAQTEQDMASGDLYSWTFNTLRRFRQPYRIEIPEVGQPVVGDMDLLPAFPYRQIRFTVSGTGFYHDLGKFIADFENNFPHARLINLVVEPVSGTDGGEKLAFKMDIVALVKPNPS